MLAECVQISIGLVHLCLLASIGAPEFFSFTFLPWPDSLLHFPVLDGQEHFSKSVLLVIQILKHFF